MATNNLPSVEVISPCSGGATTETDISTEPVMALTNARRPNENSLYTPPNCEPPFPDDVVKFDKFLDALCLTESQIGIGGCICCDDVVAGAYDTGRYQITPLFVADLFAYYCEEGKTPPRNETVCTELKTLCPKFTTSKGCKGAVCSECAKDPNVAKRLIELWFRGRYSNSANKNALVRRKGESEQVYLLRVLRVYHCGNPNPCAGLNSTTDWYFKKFWCAWTGSTTGECARFAPYYPPPHNRKITPPPPPPKP